MDIRYLIQYRVRGDTMPVIVWVDSFRFEWDLSVGMMEPYLTYTVVDCATLQEGREGRTGTIQGVSSIEDFKVLGRYPQ